MDKFFATMANKVSHWAGSPAIFMLALGSVLAWALSGPFFHFSDTWELVINTGTTIVTFLMVFLIQNTQNRDSAALHAKLDELIRVGRAQNRFIGIEHLTDKELETIRTDCENAAGTENCEVAPAADPEATEPKKKKPVQKAAASKLVAAKTAARKPATRKPVGNAETEAA